ncbi:calcium-binding protein [Vogesella indigofera]|uniref:calcium-binding protein n=1 Tax=Vogesella indigofera TaxID=45465 RepID=UPI00234F0237|nr:calcium-binding protein [Vogesella indigofera]MDC7711577.1 calcium-binding protein [Vogesella indigofera]
MTIYYFSGMANNQQVAFNPLVDRFVFDVAMPDGWGAQVMNISWGASSNSVGTYFEWQGKTVYLNGLQENEFSTSSIVFTDASRIVYGDNTAGSINDDLANTLYGGAKADELDGFGGNDTLYGGGGDDWLFGGGGSDVIVGGSGYDTLSYYRGDSVGVVVDMVARTATQGVDIDKFSGIEAIRGTNKADKVTGDGQDNSFKMLGGNDTINGGAGWDTVNYNDREATAGINANLSTGVVTKQFKTLAATDSLSNVEEIRGTKFADTIVGSSTKDEDFYGNDGNDSLSGGGGNDYLYGGSGNDALLGGNDDDILYADIGTDRYDGGTGLDEIDFDYFDSAMGVKVDLTAGKIFNDGFTNFAALATPSYETITGVEGVMGSYLNDTITGSAADNWLIGQEGNDWINGANGDDEIHGGGGSDTLYGGNGSDVIYSDFESEYYFLNYAAGTNDKISSGAGNDEIFLGDTKSTVYFEHQGLLNFDYINGFDGLKSHVADPVNADKLAIRQSTLKIGDGDAVVEGISVNAAYGNTSELVFKATTSLADMTVASEASKVLGSASAAYTAGRSALFVIDNGSDSTLYRFVAADADAAVEANELQLLGVVTGDYHALAQGDFLFY